MHVVMSEIYNQNIYCTAPVTFCIWLMSVVGFLLLLVVIPTWSFLCYLMQICIFTASYLVLNTSYQHHCVFRVLTL